MSLFLFITAYSLLVTVPADAAFVQATSTQCADSATTQVYSFSTAPVVNNYVFVVLSAYAGTINQGTSTVTDNKSNTYTRAIQVQASANAYTAIHSAKAATSGGTFTITISVVSGTGNYFCSAAMEWDGITSATLDQTSSNTGTGVLAGDSGTTAATTTASELVVASIYPLVSSAAIGISSPATTGYTALGVQQDNSAHAGWQGSYKTVSATGTQIANWTWTAANGNFGGVIATYALNTGGPVAAPRLTMLGVGP